MSPCTYAVLYLHAVLVCSVPLASQTVRTLLVSTDLYLRPVLAFPVNPEPVTFPEVAFITSVFAVDCFLIARAWL